MNERQIDSNAKKSPIRDITAPLPLRLEKSETCGLQRLPIVPRAFFIEIFCLYRKFLVYNLVQRNLKLKYRQSLLGWLWTVLVPAASALTYFLVFQYVMKVKIQHYLLFVIIGTLPWTFFSTVLMSGMESLVSNQPLINKVPLPLQVFPFTETITGFLNLIFAVPIIVIIAVISGSPVTPALALLPLYIACLFFQAYGFSLLLSVFFVYFRDLRHAVAALMQMWFYATPILYSAEMIPESIRPYLWLNPISTIFEGLHKALVFGTIISIEQIITMLAWTTIVFVGGSILILKKHQNLVERM